MRLATIVLAVILIGSAVAAQDGLSDATLLEAFDKARFFDSDATSIRTRVVSETPDETSEAEIRLLFGEIDGASISRIEFLAPDELAGQIYLVTPEDTFFFGPDLDEPLAVGGTQAVFGDSAVAQTAGIRFAEDYTVDARRVVTDENGQELIEVDLDAVDFSVAFQQASVKADPETLRPISVVLYAFNEDLPFYEVFYEDYATRGESDVYAKVQRIENRLLVGRITTSEILEIGTDELDEALFDPSRLAEEP